MMLILKRIRETTRIADIEDFLAPALKGGLLKKSGRIESVAIQMHRKARTAQCEYYAIVNVEPDVVAKRVIKQLNRKLLNGKPINIAELHLRHYSNDRYGRYQSLDDRLKACRRRKDMEIIDITAERSRERIDYDVLRMRE